MTLLLSLVLACGAGAGGPEAAPTAPPTAPTASHVKDADPSSDKAVACCSDPKVTAVVGSFVGLAEALAADDLAAATERHTALAEALTASRSLEGPGRYSLDALAKPAAAMTGKDLAGMRAALPSASEAVITLVGHYRGGSPLKVTVAHCPMAPEPGRWLQVRAELENPYFGADMLSCGTFQRL